MTTSTLKSPAVRAPEVRGLAANPQRLAVIGAGPVGLSLALHASRLMPQSQVHLFDRRALDADVSGDPRTLAMSLGSVQLLQRVGAWHDGMAQPIVEVHVSQQAPTLMSSLGRRAPEAWVRIRAEDEGVPMLGAVLSYGKVIAALQRRWEQAAALDPTRLVSRFATPVHALKPHGGGVEVDADIAETFDLAVIAEGGVFAEQHGKPLRHDYGQTAWVGQVELEGSRDGVAFERFTRHGPAALLPLGPGHAALVWCVDGSDDPVADLSDEQRRQVLNTIFPIEAGRIAAVSPLKAFGLGLNAERTLVEGAWPPSARVPSRVVRIGNAAQTLHPVAGQGLNLGLRDAFVVARELARTDDLDAALRCIDRERAPDRWTTIGATDFLARSFIWQLPGAATARGLGLAAMQALRPLKSMLTRQMMYGRR